MTHLHAIDGYPYGLLRGVPDEVYHQRQVGVISKSGLDQLHRSPAHYHEWAVGEFVLDTPAMQFGRLAHVAVLEPDRYAETYAVEPDFGDLRCKSAKEAKAAWQAEHPGAMSIRPDWGRDIEGMAASIRRHPVAGKILTGGEAEVTVQWIDPISGLAGKSRVDYLVTSRGLAVDLKTTSDASPDAFRKSVATYRYHVQEALYRMALDAAGEPIRHFAFVAVEKTPPFAVAVYTLEPSAVSAGTRQTVNDIETLARCVESGRWPGYSDHIQTLELPAWAQ